MLSILIRIHIMVLFLFFFQAEDGIRDVAVTGVQTCALPIYQSIYSFRHANPSGIVNFNATYPAANTRVLSDCFRCTPSILNPAMQRSEERRVGKECKSR